MPLLAVIEAFREAEVTPEAARTAKFVASSTAFLILTRSKKTAGSMGWGRGAM
jgi:hypothetical protein